MAVIYLPQRPNFGSGFASGIGESLGRFAQSYEREQEKKRQDEQERIAALAVAMKMPGAGDPDTPAGQYVNMIGQKGANPRIAQQMIQMKMQQEDHQLNQRVGDLRAKLSSQQIRMNEEELDPANVDLRKQERKLKIDNAQLTHQLTELQIKAEQEQNPQKLELIKAQIGNLKSEVSKRNAEMTINAQMQKQVGEMLKNLGLTGGGEEGGDKKKGAPATAQRIAAGPDGQVSDEPPEQLRGRMSAEPGQAGPRAQLIQNGPAGAQGLVPQSAPGAAGGRGNAAGQGESVRGAMDELSPVERLAVASPLMKAQPDVSGFASKLLEVTKPQYQVENQNRPDMPGFEQKVRTDIRTGRQVPIGQPIDKRANPPKEIEEAAQGVDQMTGTLEVLKDLGERKKLGGRASRQVDQWLVDHGVDPAMSGDPDATRTYETVRSHAINAVTQMLKGTRQSVWLEQQMQKNVPQYTDSPQIKASKNKAMQLIMDVAIKDLYENTQSLGQRVPAALSRAYKERGLEGKEMKELRSSLLMTAPKATDGGTARKDISKMTDEELLQDLKGTD